MLYVTTRNKTDSYTAYRALHECAAADGGQFLPIRLPVYDAQQLQELAEKSFNDIVAQVLNVFFSAHLTGWDIEFAIGRKPIKIVDMGRKIVIAELWRNTEGSFATAVTRIYDRLCEFDASNAQPSGWATIAIRIAFLFGLYGELHRMNIHAFDAAASGKDMESSMALWYAREMGLPVGKIICGTNENCWAWDLIHKGEVNPSASVQTDMPDMDTIPLGIERLIFSTLGFGENMRYLKSLSNKSVYKIDSGMLSKLNKGLFSAVVGKRRISDVISSVSSTNGYLLDSYTAISYGALQDYRAKTGENKITLLISEENPA